MEEVKVGVFLADGGSQLSEILDFDELTNFVKKVSGVVLAEREGDLSSGEGLQTIVDAIKKKKINRVVVAETLPKLNEVKIVQAVEDAGLNPYLVEVIDLKNHCAWPHRDEPKEATAKAKAMLLAAIERAKLLEPIDKLEFPALKSVLVIGGGLAGTQAASDLSELGLEVHLVEREPFIGGIAKYVSRFFPTDDCAICIQSPSSDVKTITHTSRKCIYRSGLSEIPNLNILTNSTLAGLAGVPGNYKATIEKKPRYVDAQRCIQCDKCAAVCPVEVPDPFNILLKDRKAAYIDVPYSYPPVYVIDANACKFHECGKCVDVCPTNAIDLDEKSEKTTLNVGAVIVATGFEVAGMSEIKEYHYGDYENVVLNIEVARMIDYFGPTEGVVVKRSDKTRAKRIVFIQCVGSRDKRYHEYCSSICCMVSLKQAIMIKERYPDTDITICYIDIRTTGREHEEYYEKARELGIKFVKGRPTEILSNPETNELVVDVEDALLNRFLELQADLVVLAPAMVPALGTKELAEMVNVELNKDGFFKEYNAKLRPTETKIRGVYLCGGVTYPKDAPTTSLHAHSAALKTMKFLSAGKIMKDQRTAVINEEYCGDCEFCPVVCPYDAISLESTSDGHVVAKVSDLKCEGCGICVGTCPLNAIDLRHSTSDQILAQVKALLSINGTSKPLVLTFACAECALTSVDSSGMTQLKYPANVRIVKVPCLGILQVHQILEAFNMGAQGVMVVGCKDDGCHYEVGVNMAEKKVRLTKQLLKEFGINPGRLKMFNAVYMDGFNAVKACTGMTRILEMLGPLKLKEV